MRPHRRRHASCKSYLLCCCSHHFQGTKRALHSIKRALRLIQKKNLYSILLYVLLLTQILRYFLIFSVLDSIDLCTRFHLIRFHARILRYFPISSVLVFIGIWNSVSSMHTAYCIWSDISSISELNRGSSSLGLFCYVPLIPIDDVFL